MAISMENYNISFDTGQEKINGNSYGELKYHLAKIKLTENQSGKLQYQL